MRYERDLQVRIRERYKRLFKTGHDVYDVQCGYVRDFILKSPALRAIVEQLEHSLPELDATKWVADNFDYHNHKWPNSEQGRAKVVWHMLRSFADGSVDPLQISHSFSNERNINASVREMTEQVMEPFVEYLEERLGTESETLYLLERLKQRIERFDSDELFARYEADTAHGEDIYDRYIQKFLFDQGADHVIAKPRTASGEADVVSNLDSDDALIEETKLYDGASYGVSYIRKGFNQAVQYAHDHGKTAAHLIVINLSDDNLQIASDEDVAIWPPRVHSSGVTVYIVVVRARPSPSASKRGSQKTVQVTREKLILATDQ
ncbi:hypothetical protein [Umezawaea sp.]|uniref:hypothetical protein n=1 Tax=Umezawaea sp. TaxID=1955258 RepID=UPI002ED592FC